MTNRHLLLVGGLVGSEALTNFKFLTNKDHAACRICGDVFQSDLDRLPAQTPQQALEAFELRAAWRINHDKKHTDAQRRALQQSGLSMLPEAAEKLASFGIIPLTDTVRPIGEDETVHALRLATRAPNDDALSN